MKLLLVEDDPDTGATLEAMLEGLGHEVVWAMDGQQALQWIAKGLEVDMLLTDILMPKMDGLEVIQNLKLQGFKGRIVAMTAQHDLPYLQAARLLGASAVLRKPFRMDELRNALNAQGPEEAP